MSRRRKAPNAREKLTEQPNLLPCHKSKIENIIQWLRKPLHIAIVGGSLVVGGISLHICSQREAITSVLKNNGKADVKKILDVLKSNEGNEVFNETNSEGEPHTIILGLRMVHGGPSSIDIFRRFPEMFEAWLKHQDGLYKNLVDLAEKGGHHFLLEGFSGPLKDLKMHEDLSLLARLEKEDPSLKKRIMDAAKEAIMKGDKNDALAALQILRAVNRFEVFCKKNGYEEKVEGINPLNHFILSELFKEKIDELVERCSYCSN